MKWTARRDVSISKAVIAVGGLSVGWYHPRHEVSQWIELGRRSRCLRGVARAAGRVHDRLFRADDDLGLGAEQRLQMPRLPVGVAGSCFYACLVY